MPVDGDIIEEKEQEPIMENIWFVTLSKAMNYYFSSLTLIREFLGPSSICTDRVSAELYYGANLK